MIGLKLPENLGDIPLKSWVLLVLRRKVFKEDGDMRRLPIVEFP